MPLTRRRLLSLLAGAAAGASLTGCRSVAGALAADAGGEHADEFLRAVRAGDVPGVERMLAGAPGLARTTDEEGRSAFVLAHLAGHTAVAELLLGRGLELDVVEAVLAEDWERAKELGEAHPGLMNAAHPIGGTPLYAAALLGRGELYRLRAFGCDPDANPPGGSGFTPARAALECTDLVGAHAAAGDLLGNGADPNVPQRAGDSILHGAVRRQNEGLVRLVLRKGGDVSARDAAGRTPLALAREAGWNAGAELLANHATVPRDHRTSRFAYDANRQPVRRPDISDVPRALQSAVTGSSHGKLEKVRELLAQDARLTFSISTDAELAIEACGHTGNRDIIRLHLDHGAPLSLPTAVSLGDLDHARFLLADDPLRIHERGPHDFALLWYAVIGRGSVAAAELLLDAGTPIEQETVGTTALHWAARRGQVDLTRYLLERGARSEVVGRWFNRAGETPLQLAEAGGHSGVAMVLRDSGARV